MHLGGVAQNMPPLTMWITSRLITPMTGADGR
jgi:hypothetical protein